MERISLRNNEAIIMRCNLASYYKNTNKSCDAEIIITNLNLIIIMKGTFGRVKETKRFPFKNLKRIGSQAAILQNDTKLDFSFSHGTEQISLYPKAMATKCKNNIDKLLRGENIDLNQNTSSYKMHLDTLNENIKGALGTLTDIIGKGNKSERDTQIVTKCPFCGAPIQGMKNSISVCEYCDSSVSL